VNITDWAKLPPEQFAESLSYGIPRVESRDASS
jgi:hypothetical protein